VREALFGILASARELHSARVLDLYAGSGALGLEALSRGAVEATFVEAARPALDAIRRNVEALGVGDRAHVVAAELRPSAPALARIARRGPFDLVLADPPWALAATGEPLRVLADLARLGAFKDDATLVVEHAARSPLDGDTKILVPVETRRYGDTALTFYKPAILGPPSAAPGQGDPTPSE
jgi:16S rRNA (guanine966-N2)-methyltransferase